MIYSAIAFAIGCLWIVNQPSSAGVYLSILLIPALWIWSKFRLPAVFFLLLGASWMSWHCEMLLNERLSGELIGKDILVEGYIANIPQQQQNQVRFDFHPEQKYQPLVPSNIRLSWYYDFPENIVPGQKWQLSVRLKPPVGMKNPIAFDYERWLFQQGIGAIGYVRKSSDNQLLSPSPIWNVNNLRYQLFSFLEQKFEQSSHRGLLQALTTGLTKRSLRPE